jgi:hypothetical protein
MELDDDQRSYPRKYHALTGKLIPLLSQLLNFVLSGSNVNTENSNMSFRQSKS